MIKFVTLALAIASSSTFAFSTLGNMTNIPDVKHKNKPGFHGQVGLAIANLPEYIGGKNTETSVLPLINLSYNDRFYFKLNRLGAWVYKSKNGFRVGGVITRHAGYDAGDLPDHLKDNLGSERDDSTMAGINAEYKNGMFSAEIGYLTDISDTSEGAKSYIKAGYTVLTNPAYTLTLVAKAEMLDDDIAEYYYTAFDDGASLNRLYTAEGTTNLTLGAVGTYKINNKWTAIGAVTATSLGDEIADSPLVEDDSYNMFLLGASYSF